VLGEEGRFFHFVRYDPMHKRLQGLEVFQLGEEHGLRARVHAAEAKWNAGGWVLKRGWTRTFLPDGAQEFERVEEGPAPFPESADLFSSERKLPDEMSFGEYARYIQELRRRGYETRGMKASLYQKLSFPAVTFVLIILGIPFAFRTGRRGALYGVGLAIMLAMVFYTVFAFFEALGKAELLPPLISAFAPNVVFIILGAYLILDLRT
jgi:lipopolysaccharide export LptBFGC system permease protein LptF